MALVQLKGVTKVYRPLPKAARALLRSPVRVTVNALERIDLEVGRGEVCVVVGPNGAGKSTLFRIITGLTTPTTGDVRVDGIDMVSRPESARRIIGFAPAEEQTLLMRHTCRENLRFHGRMQAMRGTALESAIDETLDFVGLRARADDAVVGLSSGMRARLQLARALLHQPDVLVLDEPTSAIDPVAARSIIQLVLEAAAARGSAVLLSSHRLEEIEALGDRVLLMDRGTAIYDGPLDGFRRRYTGAVVEVTFTEPPAAAALREAAAVSGVRVRSSDDEKSVQLDGIDSISEAIALIRDTSYLAAIEDRTPNLLDVLERAWGTQQ